MVTQFNIEQSIVIEQSGGSFCEACLLGKPVEEQSPDHRYCQSCYEFLMAEVELLPSTRKLSWCPVSERDEALPDGQEGVTKPSDKGIIGVENSLEVLLQKNKGGRPIKEGEVTRMTKWRRGNGNQQGRLL